MCLSVSVGYLNETELKLHLVLPVKMKLRINEIGRRLRVKEMLEQPCTENGYGTLR